MGEPGVLLLTGWQGVGDNFIANHHCNFKASFCFHVHPQLDSGLLRLYQRVYFSL